MKLEQLKEAVDTTSESSDNIKAMKSDIDHVAKLLFGVPAGPVKDAKRSKDAKFYGVAHLRSIFIDPREKPVYLTFDNSTDSGEFEINSLVPMMVEKGSPEDHKILALYKKTGVKSKKRTNYIAHGDKIVLREVHLGQEIGTHTVRFVKTLIKILTNQPIDDDPKKDEPPQDEPKPKKEEKPKAKKEVKEELILEAAKVPEGIKILKKLTLVELGKTTQWATAPKFGAKVLLVVTPGLMFILSSSEVSSDQHHYSGWQPGSLTKPMNITFAAAELQDLVAKKIIKTVG